MCWRPSEAESRLLAQLLHLQKGMKTYSRTYLLGITLLLGFLMVSTFRYRSFKDVDLRSRRSARLVPLLGFLVAAVAAWRPDVCLAGIALIYALSAPVARVVTALIPHRTPPAARVTS